MSTQRFFVALAIACLQPTPTLCRRNLFQLVSLGSRWSFGLADMFVCVLFDIKSRQPRELPRPRSGNGCPKLSTFMQQQRKYPLTGLLFVMWLKMSFNSETMVVAILSIASEIQEHQRKHWKQFGRSFDGNGNPRTLCENNEKTVWPFSWSRRKSKDSQKLDVVVITFEILR